MGARARPAPASALAAVLLAVAAASHAPPMGRHGSPPRALRTVARGERRHATEPKDQYYYEGEGETEAEAVLVKEHSHCGTRGERLTKTAADVSACAALAHGAGATAFSLGVSHKRGYCYAEELSVDAALLKEWDANRANPRCPAGDWTEDKYFDFYAIGAAEATTAATTKATTTTTTSKAQEFEVVTTTTAPAPAQELEVVTTTTAAPAPEAPSAPAPAMRDSHRLVGCYALDNPQEQLVQPKPPLSPAAMSVNKCHSFCLSQQDSGVDVGYFLLTGGSDCACLRYVHKAGNGSCKTPCTGKSTEMCGGARGRDWSVYKMYSCPIQPPSKVQQVQERHMKETLERAQHATDEAANARNRLSR